MATSRSTLAAAAGDTGPPDLVAIRTFLMAYSRPSNRFTARTTRPNAPRPSIRISWKSVAYLDGGSAGFGGTTRCAASRTDSEFASLLLPREDPTSCAAAAPECLRALSPSSETPPQNF